MAVTSGEPVRKTARLSKELATWLENYAKEVGATESAIMAIAVKQMKDSQGRGN